MYMKSRSRFDTGQWSEVNGLPGQNDIIHYLEFLLSSNPNRCYSRSDLMNAVAREFEIPEPATEAEGPKSNTPAYYTRLTYLITDAIQGKRRADGNQFAKRIALGIYQHITGNGVIVLPKDVEECRVSVRILKNLKSPFSPEQIMVELSGRMWSDNVIETAINLEFDMN